MGTPAHQARNSHAGVRYRRAPRDKVAWLALRLKTNDAIGPLCQKRPQITWAPELCCVVQLSPIRPPALV